MIFSWTAVISQLISIIFLIFIIYVGVTLVKNSNSNKHILQSIESELKKLNDRMDRD